MARATKPETSDWVSDPELRAKVSEVMKGSVPNFIESLTISRGAIETYKKLFALNPKIMDASGVHSNDMDAWLKNMKQS